MKINLKNNFFLFFLISLSYAGGDSTSYNGSEIGYLFDHPSLRRDCKIGAWKSCSYATDTNFKTWDEFATYNPETSTHKIKWRHPHPFRVMDKETQEEVYDIKMLGGNNSLHCLNYHVSAFSSDGQSMVIAHGGEIQRPIISNKPYREIVGLRLSKSIEAEKIFKIKDYDKFCSRLTAIAISNDGKQCFAYDLKNKKIVWFKEGKFFKEIILNRPAPAFLKLGYQEFLHRLVLIDENDTSFLRLD